MLGRRARGRHELVFAGSLRELIPGDHVLVRVDRALDLGWLRTEVAERYAAGGGRPGTDPEAAVRLTLAGPPPGIVHDRRLMREAAVNIAVRRFAGCRPPVRRLPSAAGSPAAGRPRRCPATRA